MRQPELTAFLGPVQDRDAEVIERWRDASPGPHAQAMIELSRSTLDIDTFMPPETRRGDLDRTDISGWLDRFLPGPSKQA